MILEGLRYGPFSYLGKFSRCKVLYEIPLIFRCLTLTSKVQRGFLYIETFRIICLFEDKVGGFVRVRSHEVDLH